MIPGGLQDEFAAAVNDQQNAPGTMRVQTQAEQARILWPFLTLEDKFWLLCGMASDEVQDKMRALNLHTLSLKLLHELAAEENFHIRHVRFRGEELEWLANMTLEEVHIEDVKG